MKQANNFSVNKSSLKRSSLFKLLSILSFAILSLFAFKNVDAQQVNTDAQDGLLTGVVLDHENLPLPNMSIVLKGTKIGTSTNFDGEFTFPQKLKEGDVLIF